MLPIQDAFPLLKTPKKIAITTHYKPDGDAIGSSLGLYHFLIKLGHSVSIISPSSIPDFLSWMPGIEVIYNYESESKICTKIFNQADIIFCLDFSRMDRVKHFSDYLQAIPTTKILIDHHLNPDLEAFQYGMSQPEKSATCELVYDFILLFKGKSGLDLDIAQCLYTGVMTDTGSFRFPATSASVHRMIADLKDVGFDHTLIHSNVYDAWSYNRMKLLGYAMYEKLKISHNGKVACIVIDKEDFKKFHINLGDTEGLVNYPLSIVGVQVSIFITERSDEVKISFRSKGSVDVSTFAQQHFNGGGHFNAAGATSHHSVIETQDFILNHIESIIS